MEEFIQVKKDNICRIKVKNQNGEVKGELVFDLEDIELPLRYEESIKMHRENINELKHKFIIIDKKEDVKGKYLLSNNEKEKLKAVNEFYQKETKSLDLFLGEGKTQMILDIMERNPYWTMYDDIGELLKPVLPILEKSFDNIETKIKEKYQSTESNVLTNE